MPTDGRFYSELLFKSQPQRFFEVWDCESFRLETPSLEHIDGEES
jgi:hypothetical protein